MFIIIIIQISNNIPRRHEINFISPRNVFSITANLYFFQAVITGIYFIMPFVTRNVGIDIINRVRVIMINFRCIFTIFILFIYRSCKRIVFSLVQERFLFKGRHIHTDAGPNLAKISIQIIKFIDLVTSCFVRPTNGIY